LITIRPLKLQDANAVYSAIDSSRPEIARWMVWYQPTYSPADAAEWVRRSCAQHDVQTGFHFAICASAGDLIGVVSLEDVDAERGTAMLGYWIATSATGRGAATAAIRQVLAWASAHTLIRCIWALIAPDNGASLRVAEANGLRLAPPSSQPANPQQLRYEIELPTRSAA
jgi:RimJ/RimL family protein N-acetyltransferase